MENQIYQASKKRLFLSWYIDLLLFLTLWQLLGFFTHLNDNTPFWMPYLIFIVIEFFFKKYIGSVGAFFLSINDFNTVNQNIYERENWLTILVGFLFVLDGTKSLVRWTQIFVPLPFFGFFIEDLFQVIMAVFLGLSSILTGYWFLKLNIKGFFLGMSMELINCISYVLSWNLWDSVAEKMVVSRRTFQGIPVKNSEIAFMQSILPEGMLVVTTIAIIAMLFTYKHLQKV